MEEQKLYSRKEMLKITGKSIAGVALATTIPTLLSGCADAIIGELADNAGYPFNQIPIDMFRNGGTGYGVGTMCGALGGAVAAIGLVFEPDDAHELTQELFKWYTSTELPITKLRLVKVNTYREIRKYMVLVIFIVAAFITPPDVVSQILLAIPMLILYEIGILFAGIGEKKKENS